MTCSTWGKGYTRDGCMQGNFTFYKNCENPKSVCYMLAINILSFQARPTEHWTCISDVGIIIMVFRGQTRAATTGAPGVRREVHG